MKRMIAILLSAVLVFSLTACGMESTVDSDRDTENTVPTSTEEQSNSERSGDSMTGKSNTPEDAVPLQTGSRILIACFSIPEDVSTGGVDAVAGSHETVTAWAESLGLNQEAPVPVGSGDTVANAVADPQNQQVLYLWEEGNMPSVTEYTENNGSYADDPDFRPYVMTFPVPEGTPVKGAVLINSWTSLRNVLQRCRRRV